jgi:hypothetical protein
MTASIKTTVESALQSRKMRDYATGAALFLIAVNYAHASIFGPKICSAFNKIAGNDLYSVLAGLGMAGLFVTHALDEGDNKVKTASIKIGLAATGLVNLQDLSQLVTGSTWGC